MVKSCGFWQMHANWTITNLQNQLKRNLSKYYFKTTTIEENVMPYLKLFCMKKKGIKIKTVLVSMYTKKCELIFNNKFLKTSKMI
jgi:hypothetical protein